MGDLNILLCRGGRIIREGRREGLKVRVLIDGQRCLRVQERVRDKVGQEFLEKFLCGIENFFEIGDYEFLGGSRLKCGKLRV